MSDTLSHAGGWGRQVRALLTTGSPSSPTASRRSRAGDTKGNSRPSWSSEATKPIESKPGVSGAAIVRKKSPPPGEPGSGSQLGLRVLGANVLWYVMVAVS